MKVVINGCFGGFGLTDAALNEYKIRKGVTDPNFYYSAEYYDIPRDCPVLVSMIEEQGTAINGTFSDLKVVEIPDGVNWYIEEYDGLEHVAERHRTWS
jgi:hypothetical protein